VVSRQQFGPSDGLQPSESKRTVESRGGACVGGLPHCFAKSDFGAVAERVESLANGHRAKRIGA
jgi:hypothetical protein